jgi:radical SAM superfamily enzyme YgiQ (UPF0313 family)
MAAARNVGSLVVVGGPDPANYLDEYLSRGADVIAIGEGELTLQELVPHLLQHGPHQLEGIQGIAFRGESGQIVRTEPRPMIADLDAQPFPDRAAIDQPAYVDVWRKHHGMGSVSLITALNEEVIQTLARMGCHRLWIGAESGSQKVLDLMKRRTNAERVRAMVHLLQKYGIEVGMFIMLGYEGEERRDLEETVEHLKLAGPNTFLTTVAYPIKGTPYYASVADRVVARRAWEEGSDRDYTVTGRHSPRYYEFATRWMVSEVALHRQRHAPARSYPRLARNFLNARIGRIGMLLTEREIEHA